MTLQEVASISGMSGLYKVLKPSKSGVIVESLDAQKKRLLVSANQKVSLLDEISIYTSADNVPLFDVLVKIKEKKGDKLGIDSKADNNALKAFMKDVLPTYDEERVYVSDIKKLVSWYSILKDYPEIFVAEKEEEVKEEKKGKGKKAAAEAKDESAESASTAKKTTKAKSDDVKAAVKKPKQPVNKNINATSAKPAPAKRVTAPKKAG